MAYTSASELEKLISNCEFENRQFVKLIEHENQWIESLQAEIKAKEDETKRIQDALSQLDVDSKQCHKQYTINRDNVESLKKTNCVLTEHVAAMNSKLEVMEASILAERKEQLQHLQRYTNIWDNYSRQYESMPLVLDLRRQEKLVDDLSKKIEENEQILQNSKKTMSELQDRSEVNNLRTTEFIVELAKLTIGTKQLMKVLEEKRKELTGLRQSLNQSQQATSERNNESNLQKLTHMHLVDKEIVEDVAIGNHDQQKRMEIESPMISMLAERDDDLEAMQMDVTSPDQINLQFEDKPQETKKSFETHTAKKVMETQGLPNDKDKVHKKECKQITDSLNRKYHQPDCNVTNMKDQYSSPALPESTDKAGFGSGNSHVIVPSTKQPSSNLKTGHAVPNERIAFNNQAERSPFVTYRATGQESVQIHMNKPSDLQIDKQYQEQGQSFIRNQNQTNQSPHVRPAVPARPSCFASRPTKQHGRPQISHPQVNNTGNNSMQGAATRRAVPQIDRQSHIQPQPATIAQARQPVSSSRLPTLQVPRSTVVHLQQQSLATVSKTSHETAVSSQNSEAVSAVQVLKPHTSSQPTSTPLRPNPAKLQSPLILQIPQHYRQTLQHNSTENAGIQQGAAQGSNTCQRVTSPPNIGQKYAPKKPSPLAQHIQDSSACPTIKKPVTAPLVCAEPRCPDIASGNMPARSVTQSSIHINTASGRSIPTSRAPQITLPDIHSTSHNNMQSQVDLIATNKQTNLPMDSDVNNAKEDYNIYYVKVKDVSDHDSKRNHASASPVSSPIGTALTPDKKSSKEDSFSPFSTEKHRQKLADMLKSPGQPDNLYKVPAKRVFSEMEGVTSTDTGSAINPKDGSGDSSNTTAHLKDKIVDNTEVESAFNFLDSFSKQTGAGAKSQDVSGNIFCFGGEDFSKSEMDTGNPFSMFGSSNNDDDVATDFSFGFNNSTTKPGTQSPSGGGSFLSLFNGGNNDHESTNSNFTFSFGASESQSPKQRFSFF